MRDIVVLIFLTGCIVAALKKPWWGVLSLAIFSYLNPHAYAWGFVRTLPVYYVLFLVVSVSTFMTKDKQPLPRDWRIPVFLMLWSYYIISSWHAYLPDIAWDRFWVITKIYLPFIFTLILINTRQKLYYLIVIIGSSIALIAVKGGIFAILTGFSHRVYGPPTTQFEENNLFALAALMTVPLLLIWRKETTNHWIKRGVYMAIPIIYIASLSSWSRGALLSMVALSFILIWHSRRKYLVVPMVFIGAFFVAAYLPEKWFSRMQTLENYTKDASAMGRIVVWKDGWNHTLDHPFTGTGFDGWIYLTERDWHSAYIEMFSEHGFIAFGLWLALILGTLITLTQLPRKTRHVEGMEWVANYCYMIRASLLCFMVGGAFLGLAYFDFLYHLIFITVLVKKFVQEELASKQEEAAKFPLGVPQGT